MSISKIAILTFAILTCSSVALSQATAISKKDFEINLRNSLQKAKGFNRREIGTMKEFWTDRIEVVEWQTDYVLPDRVHHLQRRVNKGKSIRIEEIEIGKSIFCKRPGGSWERAKDPCMFGLWGDVAPSQVASEKYLLKMAKLDGQDVKMYRSYKTFSDKYSAITKTELIFNEVVYWLDRDDRIVRQETKFGILDSGTIRSTMVEKYTYDPTIKIVAPIK